MATSMRGREPLCHEIRFRSNVSARRTCGRSKTANYYRPFASRR
ncbi:hypothetical protein BIFGAL_02609 [Bifidobacterium gallicum DSM 20093 = LMG 11596]|uniref:Uncharacterized protein n=1 Tax=Bifidobacterium gallicum DSM 20093 = LMG 11596 TaxID=561180 RepID=D1NS55_9BIFI|nr:hypothetical protein BIFGAL_02609 [Bifidobacterium gallicum DSM 20093 = LMG 11596]